MKQHHHIHKQSVFRGYFKISIFIHCILINQAFIRKGSREANFGPLQTNIRDFLRLCYRKGKWLTTYDVDVPCE